MQCGMEVEAYSWEGLIQKISVLLPVIDTQSNITFDHFALASCSVGLSFDIFPSCTCGNMVGNSVYENVIKRGCVASCIFR